MKNWGNTNLWNRTRSNEQIGVCTIQTLSDSLRKGANCPAFFARILLYTQQAARAKFPNAPRIAILWKTFQFCRTTPLVFHTSLLGSLHNDPQNRVFSIFLSRFGKLINWAQLLALLSVRRFLWLDSLYSISWRQHWVSLWNFALSNPSTLSNTNIPVFLSYWKRTIFNLSTNQRLKHCACTLPSAWLDLGYFITLPPLCAIA